MKLLPYQKKTKFLSLSQTSFKARDHVIDIAPLPVGVSAGVFVLHISVKNARSQGDDCPFLRHYTFPTFKIKYDDKDKEKLILRCHPNYFRTPVGF